MDKKPRVYSIGDKFGQWTIKKNIVSYPKDRAIVLCECSCGSLKEMLVYTLFDNASRQCKKCAYNQKRVQVNAGDKFSNWTVISELSKRKGKRVFQCICKCGKVASLGLSKLTTHRSNSCRSCSVRDRQYKGYEDLSGDFWRSIKHNANIRNIPFNITISDAYQIFINQNGKCALSGQILLLKVPDKLKNSRTASLDRIDSKIGYTVNNIQWVHKDINRMKQSYNEDYFKHLCKRIVFYRNDHNISSDIKWDRRMLDLALMIGGFSKDPSTGVGAVIVDDLKRIKGIGFNGFARGIKDEDSLLRDRKSKLDRTIHAEINSVLNSSTNIDGCTIYLTIPPCNMCTNFLIQAGIKRIVWFKPSKNLIERWGESWALTYSLLQEANIKTTEYTNDVD